MFFLLKKLWNGLKWLGGVIISPLAKLKHVRGIGRIVRYAAHAFGVLSVLLVLLWANYFFELDTALRTPLPLLRMVWLPLLSGLVYSLIWLGWYVCRFIGSEDDPSPFPDIDQAWEQAMRAVTQAGVDIANTPLYLLVGRPAGEAHDVIRAAGIPLTTPPTPATGDDPPLQIFANNDAIYVSCSEVSLLGRQAGLFSQAQAKASDESRRPEHETDGATLRREFSDADVELTEFPMAREGEELPLSGPAEAHTEPVAHEGLSLVEDRVALLAEESLPDLDQPCVLEPETLTELDPLAVDLSATLLKNTDEVEQITARLRHLCHLIVEERHPYVPVSGVVALVPGVAADCDEAANHVGILSQQDLAAIHEVTQVHCPHVVLVCDLEQTPGGEDLLARFPREQRQRRLGVRFPEMNQNDVAEVGQAIDDSVRWLCDSLLPTLVYRLIQTPRCERDDEQELQRGNRALYRFLHRMRQRRGRLARILRHAAGCGFSFSGSLAGCYLAATGGDSQREQGFTEAVFSQLPQFATSLTWTEDMLRHDRSQQRLANAGYAVLAGLAALLLVTVFA